MQCKEHEEREATAICVTCSKALCNECDEMVEGKHYCKECGERMANMANKDKKIKGGAQNINGFLWFIFSLVPGAGHMYMGLMKRGVLLLGAFLAAMAVENIISMWGIGALAGMLIYVYAFFDSLGTKKALDRGEVVKDEGWEKISLGNINYYYVGIFIIVIGVLSLIRTNLTYFNFAPIIRDILYGIQNSIFPILLIVLGLYLIRKAKKEKKFEE